MPLRQPTRSSAHRRASAYDFTRASQLAPVRVTVVGVLPDGPAARGRTRMKYSRGSQTCTAPTSRSQLCGRREGRFSAASATASRVVGVRAHAPPRVDTFARPLERRGRGALRLPGGGRGAAPADRDALAASAPACPHARRRGGSCALRIPDEEKANPRRFVALDLDGSTQAYAIYRREPGWQDGSTSAKLDVQEAIGATPQATAEIWRYLLDVDWTETIGAYGLPLDHPLFLLLATPRRARMRTGDALWVRLVDVGAALSGRSYAGDGAVVFDVRDSVCPWNEGRWVVEAGESKRTDAEADIALDVSALGSAYLGAVSFGELRSALRLEELKEGAAERADALFGWRPLPWCPEISSPVPLHRGG